jgi:hypothetical protein
MNLHRELFQDSRQEGIAGKSKPAGEEVTKYDYFVGFGSRNLFVEGSASTTHRKESGYLVVSDQICSDFRFTENKRRRERF